MSWPNFFIVAFASRDYGKSIWIVHFRAKVLTHDFLNTKLEWNKFGRNVPNTMINI